MLVRFGQDFHKTQLSSGGVADPADLNKFSLVSCIQDQEKKQCDTY